MSNNLKNKIVVYTAIFGDYDKPKSFKKDPNCDFVFFTDNESLKSDTFDIRLEKGFSDDNTRNAKIYKILPHKFFPEYKYSIWIDGSLVLKDEFNAQEIIDEYLNSCNMATFKNPGRVCVYDEFDACINRKCDNVDIMEKQRKKYLSEEYPYSNGLVSNHFLVRKHNEKDVVAFSESWWKEICNFSRRDQLSFNYIANKLNFKFAIIDKNNIDNEYHSTISHNYFKPFKQGNLDDNEDIGLNNTKISFMNKLLNKIIRIKKYFLQQKGILNNFGSNKDEGEGGIDMQDQKEGGEEFSRKAYSQDGEDIALAAFYETRPEYKGFYVDIGALHPFRFSNTQYFYERGWRGINVDATPDSMIEFNAHRLEDTNVEVGISTEKDVKDLTFYCFEEGALNSFNKELSEERIEQGWKLNEKKIVKTISINDLLEKYLPKNQRIDFMNVDVEGLDFEILKSLNWKKYRPDFLLVEDLSLINVDLVKGGNTEMHKFLSELGYIVAGKTMRTLIYKTIK